VGLLVAAVVVVVVVVVDVTVGIEPLRLSRLLVLVPLSGLELPLWRESEDGVGLTPPPGPW